MTSVAVVGSTGLVGSNILSILLLLPSVSSVHSIARRTPTNDSSNKLQAHISTDTSTWAGTFSSMSPPPTIFISSLGTTKAAAGSVAAQRAIDYDLNLSLAKAAKSAGVRTYVLISFSNASSSSMIPYSKMKGELEDAVQQLEFDQVVILRPGLIVGQREETRVGEGLVRWIATQAGNVSNVLKDFWAQDASVIGRAAVHATFKPEKRGPKVKVLQQKDIVSWGRTEWHAFEAEEGKDSTVEG